MKTLHLLCVLAVLLFALALTPAFGQKTPAFGRDTPVSATSGSVDRLTANSRGIFLNDRAITYPQAMEIVRPYPEALKFLKSGRNYMYGSYAVAFAGGWMVGWGVGSALNSQKRPSTGTTIGFIAGGAAVIGGALGLSHVSVGCYKKAAQVYNDATGLSTRTGDYGVSLSLTSTNGGLGFQFNF